jgi:3-deoxy-manno-octulosonate cytidylyltransferase (CMP-KDO synthetase)
MITSSMIDAAIAPLLQDHSVTCVNLVSRIANREDYLDRNTIKVVMDVFHNALYFSRSPIPSTNFEEQPASVFKQVCVIPFRRDFLRQFASWLPTPLEKSESIDMLRILEHGGQVRLVETQEETHAVDTVEDLRRVEMAMKGLSKQLAL